MATDGSEANYHMYTQGISADGRWVGFTTIASNLVAGDTNATFDVFVRDRQSGTTERVSVGTGGAQGNAESIGGSMTAHGRFVAFASAASNLVAGDSNGFSDLFVRDRHNGTNELVSVATGGTQGNLGTYSGGISADGRFVVFSGAASNFVAGDTNGLRDVFVRDRRNGTTERVSLATGGTEGNAHCDVSSISPDGRFVAFQSYASNLVVGDTGGFLDAFVHDRQNGTTERVSVDSGGAQGNSRSGTPSISADGRFVAFWSWATNLVAGDTNGKTDIFVRDRQSGTTERVSMTTSGIQSEANCGVPAISADGRWVAFHADNSSLIPGPGGWGGIFMRDRRWGTTEYVSVGLGGVPPNQFSFSPVMSADARFVAFQSRATNLVFSDTNGYEDTFVRDRGGPPFPPPLPFCFGDGSGTACPCGNAGVTGHGCGNSIDASGAILSGSGNTSISGDTLVLAASGMPDAFACYFQGTWQYNGGLGFWFADGLYCAGGIIIRLGTKLNVAGASQYPGAADAVISLRGQVTSADTRTYQVWYRNAAAFCTTSTFNLTNGLTVHWRP